MFVSSFVNAHDIAVFGDVTVNSSSWNLSGQIDPSSLPDPIFDQSAYDETRNETCSKTTSPPCRRAT